MYFLPDTLAIIAIHSIWCLQVYDQSRPSRDAQKLLRDTGNPTMLSKARDVGT